MNWTVVLWQELHGRKLEFFKNTDLRLILFELGNNANHYSLKVENAIKEVATPTFQNHVNGQFDGEFIGPNQIMVEEMAISFKCDDDDDDERNDGSPTIRF